MEDLELTREDKREILDRLSYNAPTMEDIVNLHSLGYHNAAQYLEEHPDMAAFLHTEAVLNYHGTSQKEFADLGDGMAEHHMIGQNSADIGPDALLGQMDNTAISLQNELPGLSDGAMQDATLRKGL